MVLIGLSDSFIPILGRYHNRSLRGDQLLVVTASGASTYHLDLASFSPSWLHSRLIRLENCSFAGGKIHLYQALERGRGPTDYFTTFAKVYHLQPTDI
jgi:hypothetical protein